MIGILMLNTRFPRLRGDIGNPDSFDTPPLYQIVDQARVDSVVTDHRLPDDLIDQLIIHAKKLEARGAKVIGASCGFLATAQSQIQEAINVPLLSSSLLLIPLLQQVFGADARIGVLTFDANKLGPVHFGGSLPRNISIHGLDADSSWYRCIANNHLDIDADTAARETLDVAKRCMNACPDTGLLLLECTNLSPWKTEIKQEYGIPVFDLVDALQWIATSH